MTWAAVIPWAPASSALRRHGLRLVYGYYQTEFPGIPVVVGLDFTDLFSRGRAVNRAAASLDQLAPDVLVCNDADSLVQPAQLLAAVRRAAQGEKVKAYTRYRRLTPEASAQAQTSSQAFLLAEQAESIAWEQEPAQSDGVVAMPYSRFVEIGGYDPRGEGWFADDLCLDAAWGAYEWPASRISGDLVHLHHEPDPASLSDHPNFDVNGRLQTRYQGAGDRASVEAIRSEAGWPC